MTHISQSHQTIDPRQETSTSTASGEWGGRVFPCVELLYHCNLDCVGLITPPDLLLTGEPVMVGREYPFFVSPEAPLQEGRSLGDPCISRTQLQVRWVSHLDCFEVMIPASARRRVDLIKPAREMTQGPPAVERLRLEGVQRLPPGSLIAIEGRAILMLRVRPYFTADHARLEMVGEEPALWSVRKRIEDIARFRTPVLIHGETGTGKELAARAVHQCSSRQTSVFRVVNCSAIPEMLVESVLFGHRKGSFTGANEARKGFFREADGGTLFLDEIGELPLMVQAKLLRALQDGRVCPVGEERETVVDVRVVAASNRNLLDEVGAGRFREDLYYRLNAHTLRLPPLRERRGDIPRLFIHFLKQLSGEHDSLARLWRPVDQYTPPVPPSFFMKLLIDDWRGNVRQLRNVAEKTAGANLRPGHRFIEPDWGQSISQAPQVASPSVNALADAEVRAEDLTPNNPFDLVRRHRSVFDLLTERLGVSVSTLCRLLKPQDFAELHQQLQDEARLAFIHESAADRLRVSLRQLFERHAYNQTHVAAELELSRNTLIRLMGILEIRRARDLTLKDLQASLERCDDDVVEAARILCVSTRAFKLRARDLSLSLP